MSLKPYLVRFSQLKSNSFSPLTNASEAAVKVLLSDNYGGRSSDNYLGRLI